MITHIETGLKMVKTRADVLEEQRIKMRDKLSDLSFQFPVDSPCETCGIVWQVSDFSQLSAVSRYDHYWKRSIGFYCPECARVVFLFEWTADQEHREDAYELQEHFRSVPLWKRMDYGIKQLVWSFQHRRDQKLYLNDSPTTVTRVDNEDKPWVY